MEKELNKKALSKIEDIKKMQKKCERTASLIKDGLFDVENPEKTKNAKDFHFGISIETPQTKAILIEKFIAAKLPNAKRVDPSEDKGDIKAPGFTRNLEIKSSFTNKHGTVNIRQVRPYQEVDYVATHTDEENYKNNRVFFLTKEQMEEELKKVNSFAHGTKESVKDNQVYEKNISFKIGSEQDKEWQLKYSNKELMDLIYES